MALSAAIEVTQLWLPQRQTEVVDVVTNSLGAVLGYTAAHALRRRAVVRSGPREQDRPA